MNTILSVGLILLTGLAAGKFVRKIKLPTVTAYVILGVVLGPHLLNLVSGSVIGASGLISNIVLGFIAFSLGQNFLIADFRRIGKTVLWISIFEACGAWLLVTLAFYFLLKQPLHIALLFGAISSATAPAVTMMVIRETKAKGSFTDTLLGVVAIDDAWCLIIFAISLGIAKSIGGHIESIDPSLARAIIDSSVHIFGAFVLGFFMAWVFSLFSLLAGSRNDLLVYTLGLILANTGLAIYFGLSVLLANIFLGAILVNINKVNFKFFDVIRTVDSPLYLIFFVLAGASLEIPLLAKLGILGAAYLVFRIVGKVGGAFLGGHLGNASPRISRNIGWGLIPQAGVALGVALVAKDTFPEIGTKIFATIVATTIIYELIGPICTKFALNRAGEI